MLKGYVGLLSIREVREPQIWKWNGQDIVVCDKGRKWLSILPAEEHYCITAMMDETYNILVWYIDILADQGTDQDGVPYFDDLYLDLIVYPDGTVIVDDMDELEEALASGVSLGSNSILQLKPARKFRKNCYIILICSLRIRKNAVL